MKSVLISIQPKWCELIANGKKLVEVRKTKPTIDVPFKVYIYCTKGKFEPHEHLRNNLHYDDSTIKVCEGQGKVIGHFVCARIDYIGWISTPAKLDWKNYYDEKSCLTSSQLYDYSNGDCYYEWHISDLIIYDKPRELGEFKKPCTQLKECENCKYSINEQLPFGEISMGCERALTRPFQSWGYVEEIDDEEDK